MGLICGSYAEIAYHSKYAALNVYNGRFLFHVTLWAACFFALFSFFSKSNLLVKTLNYLDPKLQLCRQDASFSHDRVTLAVRWSKTIQYRQRTLRVSLPRVLDCPLCPTHTLILCLRLCNSPPPPRRPLIHVTHARRFTSTKNYWFPRKTLLRM